MKSLKENQDLCDSRTWRQASLLSPALDSRSFRHRLGQGLHTLLLLDWGGWRGEERVGDEVLEADPVLGVPLEQVVEEVGELRRGPTGHPGGQAGIPLIELFQSLGNSVSDSFQSSQIFICFQTL